MYSQNIDFYVMLGHQTICFAQYCGVSLIHAMQNPATSLVILLGLILYLV